jgi:uncharacterized protein (TIGR03118 family)
MKSFVKFRWFIAFVFALSVPSLTSAQHYTQTNLVSDGFIPAPTVDANLKNSWGISRSTTSPWWVSDNNAGVASVYTYTTTPPVPPATVGTVTLQRSNLVVTIPIPPAGTPPSTPTGTVFNGSSDFVVGTNPTTGAPAPAAFIFCTEDGTISGWNPGVNAATAVLKVNNSPEAVYKGCTTGDIDGVRFLYVTNFRRARIEVYDTNFKEVHFSEEAFDDDRIPHDFAPFNVQNIGGSLFVTYAKQDSAKHDDVAGDGLGYVDIFSPSGKLEARLQHGLWFNAPWGVVWAPRDFGEFSNRVLVGNFGSGTIAAFDGFDGRFIGFVKNPDDSVLAIDGLWALAFGNSAAGCPNAVPAGSGLPKRGSAGPYNSLFFTAGPDGETHGLMGTLTPVSTEQDGDEE